MLVFQTIAKLPQPYRHLEKNKLWARRKKRHCDNHNGFDGIKWFRLVGPAGTQIPSPSAPEMKYRVSSGICGTSAAAWMEGNHPEFGDGLVTTKICFPFHDEVCFNGDSLSTNIAACIDNYGNRFYVYQFQPTYVCTFAYCGL